jgi:lipid-A-disaccharide synthase
MLDAIAMIYRERTDVQFVVVVAPSRSLEEATKIVSKHAKAKDLHSIITLVHHGTRDALAASDVAAVASGTATLEAALLGTPMVVVYKASAINWHTLGRLIEVEHYGLVNLVAGKRVAAELMQNDLSGGTLALELLSLLEPKQNQTMRAELSRISGRLGEPGASRKAARAILEELAR